jgi:hypothetical protein
MKYILHFQFIWIYFFGFCCSFLFFQFEGENPLPIESIKCAPFPKEQLQMIRFAKHQAQVHQDQQIQQQIAYQQQQYLKRKQENDHQQRLQKKKIKHSQHPIGIPTIPINATPIQIRPTTNITNDETDQKDSVSTMSPQFPTAKTLVLNTLYRHLNEVFDIKLISHFILQEQKEMFDLYKKVKNQHEQSEEQSIINFTNFLRSPLSSKTKLAIINIGLADNSFNLGAPGLHIEKPDKNHFVMTQIDPIQAMQRSKLALEEAKTATENARQAKQQQKFESMIPIVPLQTFPTASTMVTNYSNSIPVSAEVVSAATYASTMTSDVSDRSSRSALMHQRAQTKQMQQEQEELLAFAKNPKRTKKTPNNKNQQNNLKPMN